MSQMIRIFADIDKSDAAIAGGKGASLGEMTQAGIPVPPGFVILSSAFEIFLEETDLNVEIDAALDSVNPKEMHTIEAASEKIQTLILGARMPTNISQDVQKFFKELGTPYVAVRSSATAEDSASAAWAGQLDSYLNTTEEMLLTNVQRCWASLFTPRAIFYRFEKKLHTEKISVAVVVQKMVNSECSGVAFSVHPVTEDRNQLIIEAGLGLGEAIVSGSITPDSYVVEKHPRRIIDANVSTQTRALYRMDSGGNEWRDIPEPQASSQVLTEKRVLELSELVISIENHYGFPCDIEWAYEGGMFYITQSRPITTLIKSTNVSQKIKLEKVYSREHSLFYVYIWNNSDVLAYNIKNVLFLRDTNSDVVSVWYSQKELESLLDGIVKKLNEEERYFQEIKETFDKYLVALKPYLVRQKEVQNVEELEEYFNDLVRWWSAMAVVAAVPDREGLVESVKQALIEMRVETQEYTDEADNVFLRFFSQHFPQYKDLMLVMTPDEIFRLKDGILSENQKTKISERKNGYALLNNELIPIGELSKKLQLADQILQEAESIGDKVLKGSIAYQGIAKGRVRKVLSKKDIGLVQEGEVVVASMTTPDYVPALKKAVAFVTDEGGITSHAAIVARELQKPCVIGTKIATKLLRDGDLVEVDADNGIVRII